MQPRSQVSRTQGREKTLGTRLDYMERDSAGAENPSPVWSNQTGLGFSARGAIQPGYLI